MNLPFVLDVAIGLIFIYLILSLLASEIQEILTALLQWRATHLKKSIENLLTGGEGTPQEAAVKNIVNDLYNNPLIKNINQEAKGGIESFLRQITWAIGKFYRQVAKKENTFGQDESGKERHSAPSYIPAETFTTTLLERLKVAQLNHSFNTLNLKKLEENEIKTPIAEVLNHLEVSEDTKAKLMSDFTRLSQTLDSIFNGFKVNKSTLSTSVERFQEELNKYTKNSLERFQESESFAKDQFSDRLTSLQQDIFYNHEELLRRLQPSLTQVVDLLDTGNRVYQELKDGIGDENSPIYQVYQEIDKDIKYIGEKLPKPVKDSLAALARRAQVKAAKAEEELNQFETEIQTWFDRSMERASGVYKRNAKGVAFIIGFLLALGANADTFHIVSRLSTDTALRSAIVDNAGKVTTNCPSNSQLDCIRQDVNDSLGKVALPLGWDGETLSDQDRESSYWQINGFSFAPLKKLLGWIVSGVAIAMGAPFWFDVLGKIMNVRNSGKKPNKSPD